MATLTKNKVSINLNCYTIRFREKTKQEYLDLQSVFGKDFKTVMQEFIKGIDKQCFKNKTSDRILKLERTLSIDSNTYTAIVSKGHNGQETYIEEVKGNKTTRVGTVKSDQFNTSPFFLLLSQPKDHQDMIIFLAQSYKQYGYKEVFEDAFKDFCKKHVSGITCDFGTLSVGSLFKKYITEGSIRKLRLRKHGLTPEVEDVVKDKKYKPEDYEIEMSIKATRNKKNFLGHLKNINLEKTTFAELFPIEGFEYEEALVEISAGNRKRILNFSDPSKFAASFEVTDRVPINSNTKHPEFDKLKKEATLILKEEIIPYLQ